MSTTDPTARAHGDIMTEISDGLVGVLKEYYGRGPTRAKTYYQDDLVVCVLRGGFTRAEQTLIEHGHAETVRDQRTRFQQVVRERYIAVVERATGRKVVNFISSTDEAAGVQSELFILDGGADGDAAA